MRDWSEIYRAGMIVDRGMKEDRKVQVSRVGETVNILLTTYPLGIQGGWNYLKGW